MKSKLQYIVAALATAIGGLALAASSTEFLESKTKEWFEVAKPISQTPFVTDSRGCLYSLVDGQRGPAMVAMLAQDKTPLCRAK